MDQFDKLLEFLKAYGAPMVLLWSIVETDLIFLVIGALLHQGYVNPYTCFPAAIFGALLHDIAVFWLAKNRASWVRERKVYKDLSPAIQNVADKLGPIQLALCRPLYGTRYPTIIFWGLQSLSYPRFLAAICTGLIPWATMLGVLGYATWRHISEFDDRLYEVKNWIFGGVLLALLTYLIVRWLRKRKTPQPTTASLPTTPPTPPNQTGGQNPLAPRSS
jgi:membrane protein DedA with SNARE-associated domain